MVVCESRDRTSSTLFARNTSRSGRASCCCASARTLSENPSSRIFLLMFLLLFVSWCVLSVSRSSNHIPVRSHPDPSWFGIGNVRSSISDREQFSYDHVSSCSRFTLRCLRFPSHLAQVSANFPLNLQKWCATICMESGFFTCHQSSCSRLLANLQVSGQYVPTFQVIYHQ